MSSGNGKKQTKAMMMLLKNKPIKSKKLRESARGARCTLRIPGVCGGDTETTVLAHPPVANGGMGAKGSDLEGAFACWRCHDVLDARVKSSISRQEIFECFIRGSAETRAIWIQTGLVKVGE